MSDLLIECQGLYKSYGLRPALSGVDLEVGPGRIVGLLGPNGSGKTTLLKLLCGLLQPTTGWLAVDGQPVGPSTKSAVSYLPDRMYFADWMKAVDLFDLFRDFYADFEYEKAIARDFILRTILTNYNEEGTVLISTHLISDIEKVLDEAIFLKEGKIMLHETVDAIREKEGKSVDALFRDIFRAEPMWEGGEL